MNQISVFIIFLFFSYCAFSQNAPSFEEEDAAPQINAASDTTEQAEEPTLDLPAIDGTLEPFLEQNSTIDSQTEDTNNLGEFDVYEPSEEISEDLAVPFPSDI